jgi:Skp family chaperone for outer membrane proteins
MRTNLIVSLFLFAFLSAAVSAQVTLKKGAVVYHGSAANTTAPATLSEKTVRAATPEWQKIESEGIDPQSARGKQLITKMNSRINKAVKSVADAESCDMVTRKKDLKDDRGRTVTDLTDLVVAKIKE